jgi:hypothetical protein
VSCRFAHVDGAYVLGALSPAERLAYERHLAACDECTQAVRTFAGLPGLLSRVEPGLLDELMAEEPVPDTLLPALSRRVGRTRRRRTALAVALAAAAAVVAVAVPVLADRVGDDTPAAVEPPVPAGTAMEPVGEVPVRARVAMEAVTWGTRLDVTCTYDPESVPDDLPPSVDYVLFVSTRDGHSEQVGSWRSVGGKTMHLTAATAADHREIASVQVRTVDGRVLLSLDA